MTSNGIPNLVSDRTYQVMAKYVQQSQLSTHEGVIAEEIMRDLELPRSTVYRKLKLPGFYKTARPINPQGYGYDINMATNYLKNMDILPRIIGFSDTRYIDIHLGRLELRPTNPRALDAYEHLNDVMISASALQTKYSEAYEGFRAAQVRINRYVNGDASAFNAAADLAFFRDLADLVSACRTLSELGQAILTDARLNDPDYWKVFRT